MQMAAVYFRDRDAACAWARGVPESMDMLWPHGWQRMVERTFRRVSMGSGMSACLSASFRQPGGQFWPWRRIA
jgi:hypothetical protein